MRDLIWEVNSHELEWFRSNDKIIRKISLQVSDHLEEKIQDLESKYRQQRSLLDELSKDLENQELGSKFIIVMDESTKLFQSLDKEIRLFRECIKDTLDLIKNYNSSN